MYYSFINPNKAKFASTVLIIFSLPVCAQAQETIAPPTIGQNTQGETTALSDKTALSDQESLSSNSITSSSYNEELSQQNQEPNSALNILGTTKVSELRRENGQVYRIEFEHSSGSKQVIEEFDSDGKIQSTSHDIEETPNLPKWRLGSW